MHILSQPSKEKFDLFLYLSHFVARAFLISLLVIFSIFAIVVSIYFGDLVFNVGNNKAKSPLFSAYVIVTPSMVPTIQINDAIVVKRIDHDHYNIGDIITFASKDFNYEGLTITHRIVNKKNLTDDSSIYTTKGDNNPIVDPATVHTDSIYGKVLFKIPRIGYISSFFSKPIHYFICLLVPAFLFIFYDVGRIVILLKKRRTC